MTVRQEQLLHRHTHSDRENSRGLTAPVLTAYTAADWQPSPCTDSRHSCKLTAHKATDWQPTKPRTDSSHSRRLTALAAADWQPTHSHGLTAQSLHWQPTQLQTDSPGPVLTAQATSHRSVSVITENSPTFTITNSSQWILPSFNTDMLLYNTTPLQCSHSSLIYTWPLTPSCDRLVIDLLSHFCWFLICHITICISGHRFTSKLMCMTRKSNQTRGDKSLSTLTDRQCPRSLLAHSDTLECQFINVPHLGVACFSH